jgi:hypothetical protein
MGKGDNLTNEDRSKGGKAKRGNTTNYSPSSNDSSTTDEGQTSGMGGNRSQSYSDDTTSGSMKSEE